MSLPYPLRSKLFVPGHRPDLFPKAFAGDADAVSFDLEDAVPPDAKPTARSDVAAFIAGLPAAAPGVAPVRTVMVRVNGTDTPHFLADLDAVALPGTHVLNLPKADSVRQVQDVADALAAAEAANGVRAPIGLLLTIESPRALRLAFALANAHPRVMGLQVGLADLFEAAGIDRRVPRNVHAALFAIRMAAAEAGVDAIDGAWPDLDDSAGFTAEAAMAAGLGFAGKSCIHPRQVALANTAFAPAEAALAHARRVVEAAHAAGERGQGAFVVDGQMVDRPFLARAEALLASVRGQA